MTSNYQRMLFALLLASLALGCGESRIVDPDDDLGDESEFGEGPENLGPGDVNDDGAAAAEPNDAPLPGEVARVAAADCRSSRLFGKDGELRAGSNRLIDNGFAGYHTGLDAIPDVAGPVKSVIDFGAHPNDQGDDTAAFLAAIAGTPSGVLFIPEGRYIITQRLEIKKKNFVLRGAGQGKTVLFFPKSLGDVYGLTQNGNGATNFSFGDGFIRVTGRDTGERLATITANAARGATALSVSSTSGISVGQLVRVVQRDSAGTLLSKLHEDKFPGNKNEDGGKEVFHFYSKVKSVQSGKVTLERPLPFELDTRWAPELRAAKPSVKEVGVEDMTLEFAGTTYPGHFKEHGYNGIQFSGLHDSWVRRVTILNADYGVSLNGCFFSTVTDVTLDTNFDRGNLVGHHGLNSSGGNDVLFTRFDVKKKFVHDLTVDGYAMGTVWSNGKGVDLNMDHHGRAAYGSLWTNLDLGAGKRPFGSGGSGNRMPHSGAFSTFWNLTARNPMKLPANDFGPFLNFVAVKAADPTTAPRPDWSIEKIDAAQLCQPDLHAFEVAQRR
jgi:Pectate lyase superfamily protein